MFYSCSQTIDCHCFCHQKSRMKAIEYSVNEKIKKGSLLGISGFCQLLLSWCNPRFFVALVLILHEYPVFAPGFLIIVSQQNNSRTNLQELLFRDIAALTKQDVEVLKIFSLFAELNYVKKAFFEFLQLCNSKYLSFHQRISKWFDVFI